MVLALVGDSTTTSRVDSGVPLLVLGLEVLLAIES